MLRPGRIALALALLAGLLFFFRARSQGSGESKAQLSEHRDPQARAQRDRAKRDIDGLARALSMVAARTVGLVMVQGQVLDRNSEEPIADAEVVFTGPSGESSTRTDAEGRYQIEVAPGFYRSYAQAEGHVAVAAAAAERLPELDMSEAVAMPRSGLAPLAGLFRDQSAVNLYLVGGATVSVRVVDDEGHSVSSALVATEGAGRVKLLSGNDVGETDGSGRVRLRAPLGAVRFRVQHPDFAGPRGQAGTYLRAGEEREVEVVLARGCIVEGEVVDDAGKPVLHGAVERLRSDGVYVPVGKITQGQIRYTQTHEGPLVLRAWPWKSPPTVDHQYQCTEGSHYTGEVFVVPNQEPTLTGYVENQSGERVPLAFVDVFALEEGVSGQQERADLSGEFAFFALQEGPFQVSVYVPGQGAVIELIDVPSSGLPLRLGGVGSIVGSVSWMEQGSMTMHYRCAFRLDEAEAAKSDAVSMPMQTLLVPVEGNRFRINDLPACPIEGSISTADRFEAFSVEVKSQQDVVLRIE